MATFPTLTPSSRTFTPGRHPHSEIPTLNGLQTRVRTSNVILEQQLRLTFIALTEAQMLSIRSHYIGQQGRFLSFTIPDSLLSGMTTPAYFTPTAYSWIYGSSPQVEDIPGTQRYTVSVELVTVPPEGANANGVDFTVSVALVAGEASSVTYTTGFDLAVTASLEAGAVGGDVVIAQPGFNLTVTASLMTGTAIGQIAFSVTVTTSITAGAAIGQVASHSWTSPGTLSFLDERLGYRFTVQSNNITCRSLGIYMPGSSIVERVRIHRVDTGASVATADITSAANAWADVSITPVTLLAGVQYVISSRRTTGESRSLYRYPSGINFNAAIGTISYWYQPPTNPDGSVSTSWATDGQPTLSSGTFVYAFARFLFN